MDYSRKNPSWRGSGCAFLKELPRIFIFVILPLEILEKTSFYPWKFCKIVWHALEILKLKTKIYGNFTIIFLEHIWRFHLLPLEISTCSFFNTHGNFLELTIIIYHPILSNNCNNDFPPVWSFCIVITPGVVLEEEQPCIT